MVENRRPKEKSMKHLILLIICISLMTSCATGKKEQQIKIALAQKKEGDIFQAQGEYTAALTRLLEAEKTLSKDPYLQNSLGLAYMGKKRYDLAVEAFTKALALNPDYVEATNNLGAAYLRLGKWDTAISNFNQVLDNLLYPTPHYPLSNLGWAYLGKKDYAQAEVYFLKSLDEKAWFITASHGLAQVYIQSGQLNRAMRYLHRCLRRSPDIPILHADLAEVYEIQGQKRQAINSWQLVLKLVPENSSLARKAERRLSNLF